mgnify:CR=1 FL=1
MLPSKPFYLIRHAESQANAAGVAAGGDLDSPLTKRGHEQARCLSPYMTQTDPLPVRLYHSPMTRVMQTSKGITKNLDIEFCEIEDLREHRLGEWNGIDWEIILPKLEAKEPPPGGEEETFFVRRVRNAITDILEQCKDGTPLIVAHGGVFHALGFMYEYAITPIQNCHLHYFEPDLSHEPFPWKVWQYDITNNGVLRKSAPFCPTSGHDFIDRKESFDQILHANRNRNKKTG